MRSPFVVVTSVVLCTVKATSPLRTAPPIYITTSYTPSPIYSPTDFYVEFLESNEHCLYPGVHFVGYNLANVSECAREAMTLTNYCTDQIILWNPTYSPVGGAWGCYCCESNASYEYHADWDLYQFGFVTTAPSNYPTASQPTIQVDKVGSQEPSAKPYALIATSSNPTIELSSNPTTESSSNPTEEPSTNPTSASSSNSTEIPTLTSATSSMKKENYTTTMTRIVNVVVSENKWDWFMISLVISGWLATFICAVILKFSWNRRQLTLHNIESEMEGQIEGKVNNDIEGAGENREFEKEANGQVNISRIRNDTLMTDDGIMVEGKDNGDV